MFRGYHLKTAKMLDTYKRFPVCGVQSPSQQHRNCEVFRNYGIRFKICSETQNYLAMKIYAISKKLINIYIYIRSEISSKKAQWFVADAVTVVDVSCWLPFTQHGKTCACLKEAQCTDEEIRIGKLYIALWKLLFQPSFFLLYSTPRYCNHMTKTVSCF